jgi:ElaB/YqjD/DUF883 family membrane-anchored ribosome-binding protein
METTPQQFVDKARQMQDRIVPQIEEARRNLADLNQRVITYVRQNPGTCLLGAIAVGFVVGKLASRR